MTTTTRNTLTELLDKATTGVEAFYQRAIELHTDERLRLLASQANEGGRIYLVGRRQASGDEHLFYDHDGFSARVAVECMDYWEDMRFRYAEKTFSVCKGKLMVDSGKYGQQQMLSVFPKLTLDAIEKKLAKGIGNNRWLREGGKMTGQNREGYFKLQCQGRDETGGIVLSKPVTIRVHVYKNPDGDDLSSRVECPYVSGDHDDRCNAINNLGPGIVREYSDCSPVGRGDCAYSFSVPWVTDQFIKRDRK